MTTAVGQMTRQRTPSIATVATTTACVFLVILVFLAAQLRAGHDPALGAGALPVAAKQAPGPAHAHNSAPLVTKSSGGG
jgi:hypothetical protein